MTSLYPLPYQVDSTCYFASIAKWPYAVMLDSCHPHTQGRYDILSAKPFVTLTHHTHITTITTMDGTYESTSDPFFLVQDYLGDTCNTVNELPFCGGALGFFSYDLAWRIEHLPTLNPNEFECPEMIIGIYDWALVIDHQQKTTFLVAQHRCPDTANIVKKLLLMWQQPLSQPNSIRCKVSLTSDTPQKNYFSSFDHVKEHIAAGDCYQVNLSQRFSGFFDGDPWDCYQQLRRDNPAPFSAYLSYPEFSILSISPEQFLNVKNRQVTTKPIKGTRPRHANPIEDQRLAQALSLDEKERAENVMIVDLLRNDLSKTCEVGSVKVPKLCQLTSFSAVHHLVSTVTGLLAPDKSLCDLLRGCFPGGSITGTPKIRAMEIINDVELHRRTVYCGNIVALSFDGQCHSNITIRTLLHHHNRLYCWAGGAIVADSKAEAEYNECFAKISLILQSLS